MHEPELTLVVPTLNERDNIRPLLDEIDQALGGIDWEALFVDDSRDGTDAVIAAVSSNDHRIRLLHRTGPRLSLAGAVVAGFRRARGRYVCVLDEARRSGADLVIASRYIPGGSAGGLAGPLRRLYSRGLKSLARALFPNRLARVTDPLGGFFLVRRDLVRDACLRPLGYKILLEVLVRTPWRSVREVPYRFRPRQYGLSKADLPQGIWFLRHLARLVWSCSPLLAPARAITAGARREKSSRRCRH